MNRTNEAKAKLESKSGECKSSSGQATKGLRWIPRHTEAMKDVVTDETSRGAGSRLRSENLRMGQPLILLPESIG